MKNNTHTPTAGPLAERMRDAYTDIQGRRAAVQRFQRVKAEQLTYGATFAFLGAFLVLISYGAGHDVMTLPGLLLAMFGTFHAATAERDAARAARQIWPGF
jgi:hypothetical protein